MPHRALLLPFVIALSWLMASPSGATAADLVDITTATIVVQPGTRPTGERVAAQVLQEELEARLGARPAISTSWPADAPVAVVIASGLKAGAPSPWPGGPTVPASAGRAPGPEGFRVTVTNTGGRAVVWVLGADGRGALFGVGEVLRALRWSAGGSTAQPRGIPATLELTSTPAYAIRGHQLGYRQHSNTYDAWDEARYDRYIRDLALFGANSIENIPLQDTRVSPHFPASREEMNVAISRVCDKYDLDYWIWTPADYDLADTAKRAQTLDTLEAMFAKMPRLDAIFVPGGDPGSNPATLVLPYLEDLATRVQRHHPRAKVWLSLQWFSAAQIDWIYEQINTVPRPWLGGLVAGPSSPPLGETRARLHSRYRLRDYPDVTHVVRAQYVVPDWDPAFNFTLGREPINPRPVFYAELHDRLASHTDGFISYSDGVNDDVNKAIWSRKAWAPEASARDIMVQYARVFFGDPVAERAADGLLALEKNWAGPLASNGAVDGTWSSWQRLEAEVPGLQGNWRWQQALFRAYYDAYTRHRLLRETDIGRRANAALLDASTSGASAAATRARAVLAEADTPGPHEALRTRIVDLGAALFKSIGMQLDTPNYKASGTERGAVLDFLAYPLNDRWWIEDEVAKALSLSDEAARVARLVTIGGWDSPGPGSFYDDIGNIARSPHVQKARVSGANPPELEDGPSPHFTWEDDGRSRKRLSWQVSLRWPIALVYEQIDPQASYVVRLNGNGQVRLRINGAPVAARHDSTMLGDPKEFVVPADAVRSRRIVLTFDDIDESDRNWRQHSRLHEAWLLKMTGTH
ncbi:hypothetical protein [Luteitalea pratensis]|uniref:hypothetical protein n=1 Tax=Luteitalea pratensis TaxID=1855912 RepID=UPI0012FF9429|nr:hypothetical protein [Luteitalea pratensis]